MGATSYVPNTDADRRAMLDLIGVSDSKDLFSEIPSEVRNPELKIASGTSELELLRELGDLSRRNVGTDRALTFLGDGAYDHFIPSIVPSIVGRGEFATAYTPYQPEISQGTLQTIFEFQSLVCSLSAMEVANSGLYDGASALAEAALMACRVTKRHRLKALDTVAPNFLDVVRTYIEGQGIELNVVSANSIDLDSDDAALLVQHPNRFGYLEDVFVLEEATHAADALLVSVFNPVSLGLLTPPGDYGADIAVAEGQSLGTPVSFGGPYLGIFTCKEKYVRQMPGRIAGETKDAAGRTGYVLTLQAREQHIRRERATSNVCTNEALVALAATVHLAGLGPEGLREVAGACFHKAHYAAGLIAAIRGFTLWKPPETNQDGFFNEFVVRCPVAPAAIIDDLATDGIFPGVDMSDRIEDGLQICVTEVRSKAEIDRLAEALTRYAG